MGSNPAAQDEILNYGNPAFGRGFLFLELQFSGCSSRAPIQGLQFSGRLQGPPDLQGSRESSDSARPSGQAPGSSAPGQLEPRGFGRTSPAPMGSNPAAQDEILNYGNPAFGRGFLFLELQFSGCSSRAPIQGLQFRGSDSGVPIQGFRFRGSDSGVPIQGLRFRGCSSGVPIQGFRFSGCNSAAAISDRPSAARKPPAALPVRCSSHPPAWSPR